jgi:hypothetical protein
MRSNSSAERRPHLLETLALTWIGSVFLSQWSARLIKSLATPPGSIPDQTLCLILDWWAQQLNSTERLLEAREDEEPPIDYLFRD